MRLSISTRNGWILSIVALMAIAVPATRAAPRCVPPEITDQPDSAEVCDGDAVTFTVVADGDPPLEYQWQKDGVPIFDAIEASYTIDPVGPEAAANYDVVVTNPCGSVTSKLATLTIIEEGPSISEHPQDAGLCAGDSVTFTVTAEPAETLSYQWRHDGADIPGANETSFTIDVTVPGDAGQYDVVVSNVCGQVTSDPATLTVGSGPTITAHPQDQTICDGEPVTFTVTVEGTEPLTYQWRRDGTPIFGENEASYTIDPVGPGADAEFDVVISNACGTVTSNAATLTVDEGPVITAQPQDRSVCEGNSVTLTVTATGLEPLTYQWRMNGTDVPGAESDSLVIDPAAPADAGDYDVVITNPCGSLTSETATLTVNVAPTITTHPDDAFACEGNSAEFEVIAEGTEPLYYQWYHDGEPIAGATEATYTIDMAGTDDAGEYYVQVANVCGSVTSDTAELTVHVRPFITEHPQGRVVCNGDDEVTFSVTVTGSEPIMFQWRKGGVNIPGATSDTYTISPVTLAADDDYDVVVMNLCGTVTSEPATLVVLDEVPTITEQPQDAARCDNGTDSITFSVAAEPLDGLSYQWRKDGVDIPDATGDTYEIPVVVMADAGEYDVVVTNPCGPTCSDSATLIVVDEGPSIVDSPENQAACVTQTVTFTVTADGPEPLSYEWYHNGQLIEDATDSSYTIDSAELEDAGEYYAVVSNPCHYATSAPAILTVIDDPPSIVQQPEDWIACEGATIAFSVVPGGDPPFEYQWYQDDTPIDGATGESYTAQNITVDDAGEYRVMVTNACDFVESDTATLTVNTAVVITEHPASQVDCEHSPVTFSVEVTGTEPYSYQWRKDGEDIAGAIGAEYTIDSITPDDAATYVVVVTNPCAEVTSDPATLTVDVGPTITQPPEAADLCVGESVTMTVAASGTEPFSYEWYKDGTPIAGATEDTYTIDPLVTDDSGQYHVVVANYCDQADSDSATLDVDAPPEITVEPEPAIIARGQSHTFCIVAVGEGLSYQWQLDGVDILDATAACHEASAGGMYACVVTNRCGEDVSNAAELTIATRLTVAVTATPPGVKLGDPVTLAATASRGLGPYTYLWNTGETTATIVETPTQNTVYTVLATDSLGQTATAEVTVAVAAPLTIQTRASAYILQPGESSTLTAVVISGGMVPFEFVWSTGETAASITVTPNVSTTFYVIVSDSLGQTASVSVTITINEETEDDQSAAEQPPADEGDQTDDDGTGDDGTGTDDSQGDGTIDDQSGQDTTPVAGLCPLVSFSMISLLVAGLCWSRGTSSRRQRRR